MNGSPIVSVSQMPAAVRQLRAVSSVDQASVEDEADDRADDERADADEQPLAQLLEVLDERGLLAVLRRRGRTTSAPC